MHGEVTKIRKALCSLWTVVFVVTIYAKPQNFCALSVTFFTTSAVGCFTEGDAE